MLHAGVQGGKAYWYKGAAAGNGMVPMQVQFAAQNNIIYFMGVPKLER